MASSARVNVNMAGSGADEYSASRRECHNRRRRRKAMRRLAAAAAAGGSGSGAQGGGSSQQQVVAAAGVSVGEKRSLSVVLWGSSTEVTSGEGAQGGQPIDAAPDEAAEAEQEPVAFGSVSLSGRTRNMEDRVSLHPSFCVWADGTPMHLFAVFDGHGGPHVAAMCREQMHVILAEEMAAKAAAMAWTGYTRGDEEDAWREALSRSFERVNELAPTACGCGRSGLPLCGCALAARTGIIVGSTAVVAVLVSDRVVVANCGDSRAVLSRGGASVPLSIDQKPDRPDELARIEAAGGRVVYLNGPRVRGILAMSRSLGDEMLHPEVICDPEITITIRSIQDDCLVLASDGMWDVISNRTACAVARQCLEDGLDLGDDNADGDGVAAVAEEGDDSEHRCCRLPLSLQARARQESYDNVGVIVIDRRTGPRQTQIRVAVKPETVGFNSSRFAGAH